MLGAAARSYRRFVALLGALTAVAGAAGGEEARLGRTEVSLSLAAGVPLNDPRQRTDYILLRQLDYFARENLTVGFALGLAGPIDDIPGTALQLQSAYNFGSGAVVPYAGAHIGVLADFIDVRFRGTAGPLLGLRWRIGERWSLLAETKGYATYLRIDESFVAVALGVSATAD